MYKILVVLIGTFALLPALAAESTHVNGSVPTGDKAACMQGPLAQFGQYIGNWDIHDSQLSQDGKEWTEGDGAKWNFVCVGDGTAIQDFWMPTGGSVGTNLRIYNADTESWDIVWAIKPKNGFTHIDAKQDENGNVVMHVRQPLPDPLRRITFFPLDADGWNWKLEFSSDGGDNWFEVYRIRATPSDK